MIGTGLDFIERGERIVVTARAAAQVILGYIRVAERTDTRTRLVNLELIVTVPNAHARISPSLVPLQAHWRGALVAKVHSDSRPLH